jgi:hypothetical protein
MNRDQRRKLHRMLDRAAVTGESWQLDGLTGGCADCDSETVIAGRGGKVAIGVMHDESCPVLRGDVPWSGFAS